MRLDGTSPRKMLKVVLRRSQESGTGAGNTMKVALRRRQESAGPQVTVTSAAEL